jgi:thioredoxin 1
MSEYVKEVNDDNFEQLVLRSETPVLVDFWAEWCAPCRALAPIVETVAKEYAGAAHVVKLNVDDSPSITQRYGVQGIPTLIVFQNGEEKERVIGAASEEAISRMIRKHISVLSVQMDRTTGH